MDSGRSQHYIKTFKLLIKSRLLVQFPTGECNDRDEYELQLCFIIYFTFVRFISRIGYT